MGSYLPIDLISVIFAELNAFFSKLDRHYDTKVKKDGNTMAKKVSKTGSITDSPPPAEAPDWTLNPVQTGNKYTRVSLGPFSIMSAVNSYRFLSCHKYNVYPLPPMQRIKVNKDAKNQVARLNCCCNVIVKSAVGCLIIS